MNIPFDLPEKDREFLLSQRQTESVFHKNISYRPKKDVLRGTNSNSDSERMREIMKYYSAEVTRFISDFLAPYAGKLDLDFASFRPLEEKGRNLSQKKRNDLLHVDSFPDAPDQGRKNSARFYKYQSDRKPYLECCRAVSYSCRKICFTGKFGKIRVEKIVRHFAFSKRRRFARCRPLGV